jgi:hypothetical protein
MFSLVASLYDLCRGSHEYNLCILGLNETGKTVHHFRTQVLFNVIKRMNEHEARGEADSSSIITYRPTVGLNGSNPMK